jgi:hypothetical protein
MDREFRDYPSHSIPMADVQRVRSPSGIPETGFKLPLLDLSRELKQYVSLTEAESPSKEFFKRPERQSSECTSDWPSSMYSHIGAGPIQSSPHQPEWKGIREQVHARIPYGLIKKDGTIRAVTFLKQGQSLQTSTSLIDGKLTLYSPQLMVPYSSLPSRCLP